MTEKARQPYRLLVEILTLKALLVRAQKEVERMGEANIVSETIP